MELAIEDALSRSIRLPLSSFNLIGIPDLLNVTGEWVVVVLGPREKVLISGGRDVDDWGRVRVVWNGEGSLWRVTCGSGRGEVSSITLTVSIITTGGWRLSFKESGVFVTPDRFSIPVSGLLGPRIDRSIVGEGGGGMSKGGGEFSCSGEGVVPVEFPWRGGDMAGVRDIVKGVGVGVGWLGLWSVVECERHA
jgi:hypothetical protein